MMSRIKSSGTKPERILEAALRRQGLRFKRQDKLRPGKPDVSFPSRKVAVFVDGIFWHRLDKLPKTNVDFWRNKIEATIARDERDNRRLAEMGWRCARFTDKEVLKDPTGVAAAVRQLLEAS